VQGEGGQAGREGARCAGGKEAQFGKGEGTDVQKGGQCEGRETDAQAERRRMVREGGRQMSGGKEGMEGRETDAAEEERRALRREGGADVQEEGRHRLQGGDRCAGGKEARAAEGGRQMSRRKGGTGAGGRETDVQRRKEGTVRKRGRKQMCRRQGTEGEQGTRKQRGLCAGAHQFC